MPTTVLTDTAKDVWVESFDLAPADVGQPRSPAWSVRKRQLHGGRREGVDRIDLDSGTLALAIVPTRGMGLWRARFGGEELGWRSPVRDGPVNPAFVEPTALGGLGWLQGFDELLARCGLEHNGAPYAETAPDGRTTIYPLHGSIANIPAHYVAVHVEDHPPHTITIEGHVDEARLFGPAIRMMTRISTTPGSTRVTVRDEFMNLGDQTAEMQVLYHWNFGPPLLEEGARVVAPARTVVPRNPRAVEGLGHYDVYGPPEPGFAEQVYFFELHGEGESGRTLALLRNRAGSKAVALRFATAQLPCFTVWKQTGGLKDGYVTGLEPATNYPNPKPFEKDRGRVVQLGPGASQVAETTLEVLGSAQAVAEAEREIERLIDGRAPIIHPGPVEPFASD
jgi:hypothetical protein